MCPLNIISAMKSPGFSRDFPRNAPQLLPQRSEEPRPCDLLGGSRAVALPGTTRPGAATAGGQTGEVKLAYGWLFMLVSWWLAEFYCWFTIGWFMMVYDGL